VESNTPGTQTRFRDSLVDFDYETWQKFGLQLYWPEEKGKLDRVWPMRVLAIRKHPVYKMVALVKKETLEEIVTFSKDTGRDPTGRSALMDLDSLMNPVLRANTLSETLRSIIRFIWNCVRILKMIIYRSIKMMYERRFKKTTT
jgi:hypothetical protein